MNYYHHDASKCGYFSNGYCSFLLSRSVWVYIYLFLFFVSLCLIIKFSVLRCFQFNKVVRPVFLINSFASFHYPFFFFSFSFWKNCVSYSMINCQTIAIINFLFYAQNIFNAIHVLKSYSCILAITIVFHNGIDSILCYFVFLFILAQECATFGCDTHTHTHTH